MNLLCLCNNFINFIKINNNHNNNYNNNKFIFNKHKIIIMK